MRVQPSLLWARPDVAQTLHDRRRQRSRRGNVKQHVLAGAAAPASPRSSVFSSGIETRTRWRCRPGNAVAWQSRSSRSRCNCAHPSTSRAFVHALAELLVRQLACGPRRARQSWVGAANARQVIQGGNQLAPRQITGSTENNQQARTGLGKCGLHNLQCFGLCC